MIDIIVYTLLFHALTAHMANHNPSTYAIVHRRCDVRSSYRIGVITDHSNVFSIRPKSSRCRLWHHRLPFRWMSTNTREELLDYYTPHSIQHSIRRKQGSNVLMFGRDANRASVLYISCGLLLLSRAQMHICIIFTKRLIRVELWSRSYIFSLHCLSSVLAVF